MTPRDLTPAYHSDPFAEAIQACVSTYVLVSVYVYTPVYVFYVSGPILFGKR